jgi:protein TonB
MSDPGSTTGGGPGPAAGSSGAAAGGARGPSSGAVALGRGPAGGEDGAAYTAYLVGLRRRIQETLEYPVAARRRGAAGTVHLEILVRPDGSIGEVSIVATSSHRLLDEAALAAVKNLPRVPFPSGLSPRPLRARLPIVFDLR